MQNFYDWEKEDKIEALASKHFAEFLPSMETLEATVETKSYSMDTYTKHMIRNVIVDEPLKIKVEPHSLKKGIIASLKRGLDNLFPKKAILTDERIFLQTDAFGRFYFKINETRYYVAENMEVAIDLEGYLWQIAYTENTYKVIGGIDKYEGDFPYKFASEKKREQYYDSLSETELDPVYSNPFADENITSEDKIIDFMAYKDKQMKR